MTSPGKVFKAVVLGPPGSGKATISHRMVQCFKLKRVASGCLLREEVSQKSQAGIEAEKFISKGLLVKNDLVIKLITGEFSKYNGGNPLVIEGFPRTLEQAHYLSSIHEISVGFHLAVPFDVLIDELTQSQMIHLKSGRLYTKKFNPPKTPGIDDITGEELAQIKQDKLQFIFGKLRLHEQTIQPVLKLYSDVGILHEFKERNMKDLWRDVKNMLENYIPVTENIDYDK